MQVVRELLKDKRAGASVFNTAIRLASENGHVEAAKQLLRDIGYYI